MKMLVTLALLLVVQVPASLSLVPTRMFATCLTSPLDLIPDPEDCHIFYQCDLNPQPMSCGNMMFNSLRQVCDWPSTVLQLRPECRQEEQFRFSGQAYPSYSRRTLRMLNILGDGDKFSQKRLRAPQDIGRGRRKNFGNREYFGEEVENSVEADVNYDYEAEEAAITNNENEQEEIVEYNTRKINEEGSSNLNFDQVLDEIRRRLPQVVQNSFSQHQDNNNNQNKQPQAESTPADTIRLQPQKISYQGPSFAYQHANPEHSSPAHIPAPAYAPAYATDYVPAPTPLQSVPTVQATVTPLLLATNIPQEQNNIKVIGLHNHNQPKLAPILVEETREYKPVWTVTRERPRQILMKYRNGNIQNQQQTSCADKNCPRQRQRVLRKIKRKLEVEARRKELIQEAETSEENIENFQEGTEESYSTEEKKALTLKEAYDRAIRKVNQSKNNGEVQGNLLNEILNQDFGEYGSHNYVNSDDLRPDVLREGDGSGLDQ